MLRLSVRHISIIASMTLLITFFFAACDNPQSLGGGWYFDPDNDVHPFIVGGGRQGDRHEGDPFIPCNVIAHAYNDQFIIAAQVPDTSCHHNAADAKRQEAANNTGNPVNFWIIDISVDKLIGPLSLNEYFLQRQMLHIPDDLKMEIDI